MKDVPGFDSGYVGAIGGTLSSAQRVARMRGLPEPTTITGTKGQGHANVLASYTIQVTRISDGVMRERMIGPGYHTRKHWDAEKLRVQLEHLTKLGYKG